MPPSEPAPPPLGADSLTTRSLRSAGLDAGALARDWRPTQPTTLGATHPPGSSEVRRRTLVAGETLHAGRFRIEAVLGSGGEGVVYAGWDHERETTVALKMLHLDGTRSTSALKREFRVLRGLIHPGLVRLHELFVDADYAFFTMAHVRGRTFAEARDSFDAVRSQTAQLAEVLDFLHRAGRVHRDVKASNVLVQEDGRVVLVDFGVALDLSREASLEDTGVGTPLYMAPELRMGGVATPSSDAYSLGVVLFETLTGRHPLLRSPADGEQSSELSRPSRLVPEVPGDLDQLCAGLLASEPSRRLGVREVVARLGRPSAELPPLPQEAEALAPLAGRDEQLRQLEVCLTEVRDGREPVVAYVHGPAGMGKSTLIEAFLAAQPGALVLSGRCLEQEYVWHKAFDGVIDELVRELGPRDDEEVLELIGRDEAPALVPLFPQLCQLRPIRYLVPDLSSAEDPQRRRNRAYEALGALLARLAERQPLIIWIDDLEWGDVDSARLLLSAFTGPRRPRCLLVLSYGSEESERSACLAELLRGRRCLADELRTTEIRVGELQPGDARRLAESLLGGGSLAPRWAEPICAAGGGSPLLVSELALHVREQAGALEELGALDLVSIVRFRLSRLPAGAVRLFGLLCCAGAGLPSWAAERLVGADVEGALAALRSARLAAPERSGGVLAPLHDWVRAAGLRLLGERAAALHHDIAELFERRGAEPARVARHYEAAGRPERAALFAARAADAAASVFAFEQASGLYRLALAHPSAEGPPTWELEARLAQALADAGHGTEAAPLYLKLAAAAPASDALRYRARAAQQLLASGAIAEGEAVLAQVFREVGLRWPRGPSGAIRQLLWNRLLLKLTRHTDRVASPRDATLAHSLQLEAARSAFSIAYVSTVHGAANTSSYLRLARRHGDAEQLAIGYGMEALLVATQGVRQRGLVEEYRRRTEHWMPQPRSISQQAFLRYVESQSAYLLGNFTAAVELYPVADNLFIAGRRGHAWEMSSSRIFWASALYYLGKHLEMDRRIVEWLEDAHHREDAFSIAALRVMRGRRVGMPDGHWDEAYELVREGMAGWSTAYFGVHRSYEALFMAHAALCQGRPDVASASMRELWPELRRAHFDRVMLVRVFHRHYEAFGELALAYQKSGSARRGHMASARRLARLLESEQMGFAMAWAVFIRGTLRALEGDDAEALSLLEDAADRLTREGFVLHAEAVRYRIGQLVGGDRGQGLMRHCVQALQRQEIRAVSGALRALAPGPEP